MKRLTLIALFFGLVLQTFAQDKEKIKAAATISANAFAKGDYNTLADHTYPKLLATIGGKKTFIQTVSMAMSQLKNQGMSFAKVVVGNPGEIYPAGTELDCLVPETITLKFQGKYMTTTTYLLAISPDKGKTWYFADTGSNSPEKLKQLQPNYNPKLVIPQTSQPVFSDNIP